MVFSRCDDLYQYIGGVSVDQTMAREQKALAWLGSQSRDH